MMAPNDDPPKQEVELAGGQFALVNLCVLPTAARLAAAAPAAGRAAGPAARAAARTAAGRAAARVL